MRNTDDLKITGEWQALEDDSAHRIEWAPMNKPGVMALRDTWEPDRYITATRTQLEKLARPVMENRLPSGFG